MSPCLWPRMEVLQLVSPQLANSGRHLTISLALSLISTLNKTRGADGTISFDRWFVVAKNHLKWNDNCVHLFWDILCMCVWYMEDARVSEGSAHPMTVDDNVSTQHGQFSKSVSQVIEFEYLVIFLLLHANDSQSKHTNASQFTYDTMWPSSEAVSTGPIGSKPGSHGGKVNEAGGGISPARALNLAPNESPDGGQEAGLHVNIGAAGSHNAISGLSSGSHSPKSPGSPRSHTRANMGIFSPRTSKSPSQHLQTVRQKIPSILRGLSLIEIHNEGEDLMLNEPATLNDGRANSMISRAGLNKLNFILGGGYDKLHEIPEISSLIPALHGRSSLSAGRSGDRGIIDPSVSASFESSGADMESSPDMRWPYYEIAEWIEESLGLNEAQYPLCTNEVVNSANPGQTLSPSAIARGSVALTEGQEASSLTMGTRAGVSASGSGAGAGNPEVIRRTSAQLIINGVTPDSVRVSALSSDNLGTAINIDTMKSNASTSRSVVGDEGGTDQDTMSIDCQPPSLSQNTSSSLSTSSLSNNQLFQPPLRVASSVSSLSRSRPTMVTHRASTLIYFVTVSHSASHGSLHDSEGKFDSEQFSNSNRAALRTLSEDEDHTSRMGERPTLFKSASSMSIDDTGNVTDNMNTGEVETEEGNQHVGSRNLPDLQSINTSGHATRSASILAASGENEYSINDDYGVFYLDAAQGNAMAQVGPAQDTAHEHDSNTDGNHDHDEMVVARSTTPTMQTTHSQLKATNATTPFFGSSKLMGSRTIRSMLSSQLISLPHLTLHACSNTSLYLLSPYQHGTILSCSDCEIVLSAIAGALIVTNCERVKISSVCRKLIVHNCVDCEFYLASACPSIVSGDCHHLAFGPYNASHKHLSMHMTLAGLADLCDRTASTHNESVQNEAMTSNDPDTPTPSLDNCWSLMYDLNSAADGSFLQGSPSGYSVDAISNTATSGPPAPPQSTAFIMPPEKFSWVSIPAPSENLPPFLSCISPPKAYRHAWQAKLDLFKDIKTSLQGAISSGEKNDTAGSRGEASAGQNMTSSSRTAIDDNLQVATDQKLNGAITTKFLDWVAASGHGRVLLDLVNIDASASQNRK